MTDELEYSIEGKLILPEFDIDARVIRIYVEGKDDIPFWQNVFNTFIPDDYSLVFEEQGGAEKIYKLLNDIGGKQTFIAALDSEYDDIIHNKSMYKNNLTIFTKRHSIENYLFCVYSINQIINNLDRKYENNILIIQEFTTKLTSMLEGLLYLECKKCTKTNDILNNISILGGDSKITKFLENGAIYPDKDKIDNFIKNNNLANIEITEIKNLFREKDKYNYLNGHFITFSIVNFIKQNLKQRKIGPETLYDNAYQNCAICKKKCKDYVEIINNAQKAFNYYVKANLQ